MVQALLSVMIFYSSRVSFMFLLGYCGNKVCLPALVAQNSTTESSQSAIIQTVMVLTTGL